MDAPSRRLDRREFVRAAGFSVLAASGMLAGSGDEEPGASPVTSFEDRFGSAEAWDRDWLNVRYRGSWRRRGDAAVIEVPPAPHAILEASRPQAEYMAQPVVATSTHALDSEVDCELSQSGPVEAGILSRWSYDEAYALVVSEKVALLCRYTAAGRVTLDERALPSAEPWMRLSLRTRGQRVTGMVEVGQSRLRLGASDEDALGEGLAGIVVTPLGDEEGGAARFRAFEVRARAGASRPPARFAYRFAGAVEPTGARFRARVAARTVVPGPIAFEIARAPDFSDARGVGPFPPEGDLGAVRAWLEGLEPDTVYHWRPSSEGEGGTPARFKTPPGPGRGLRFVFGSCTSGRVPAYPSFARAASFDPSFYLHAGDWGYANFNSYGHREDHFQSRWTRLLRMPEVAALLSKSPLMFWQDDHDYQADNGWSETCQPYAVRAFDELHANPTDEYFEIRWGDLHVWCLDCRLFASDPGAPDGPGKTRLGKRQKAWLLEGMSRSDAPVRIVASAMAFRDKVVDDPGWHNAYGHERDELLGFFSSLDATVAVLSGDSHGQRLIHHHEFGELFEVTSSGTDFDLGEGFGQGLNDPEHTLVYRERTGFAVVELDGAGPGRRLSIRCIASDDGSVLIEKSLPV